MTYVQNGLIQAADFNSFAAQSNDIYRVGYGDKGYGQTAIVLPTVTGGLTKLVESEEWTNFRSILSTCATHQGRVPDLPLAPDLAVDALIKAHPPAPGSFASSIATITANRANSDPASTSILVDMVSSTRATTWTGTLCHEFQVTFASADAARYFFNSGGQIRVRGSRSGGSATIYNTVWTDLLNSAGSICFGGNDTTSTSGIGAGVLEQERGYYDLPHVAVFGISNRVYRTTSTNLSFYYGQFNFKLYAYTDDGYQTLNGDNGRILKFRTEFECQSLPIGQSISGTLTSNVDIRKATSPLTIPTPTLTTLTTLNDVAPALGA